MAVPATFLNGEPFYNGKMELAEILAKIDTGSEEKAAEKLSAKAPFEVLVVGGGPAGAATAIYTARKGFSTGIAAERFGGQLHDTLGIENLPGTPYTEGPKLAGELKRHVGEYDIDLMDLAKAVKLVPAKEEGGLHTVEFGNGASLKARSLILATGARWRNLGVPGEAEYRNKGVAYCPHCDGPLFKGKRIAVVGGGNSGVEAAIDLAKIVGHVTLIEYDDKLRADEVLQKKLRSMSNVDIVTSGQTTEITGKDGKVNGLVLKDRKSGAERRVELEGVFIQIGLVPNTEWLKDSGLELTKFGEIATDEEGRTNLPGVFGAGDVTDVPYKQIVVAMGEGSKAGLSAFDYLIRTEPVEDIAQAA
jgi:NADH-dependent peroxiredoxin subunit F